MSSLQAIQQFLLEDYQIEGKQTKNSKEKFSRAYKRVQGSGFNTRSVGCSRQQILRRIAC